MAYSQSELDVFVGKLLAIQHKHASRALSREERKELALSIGISEEAWLEFENDFESSVQRGHSFRQSGNDDDAIAEYVAAFIIDPYHEGLLLGLARSHARRYRQEGSEEDKVAAERYARRLLEINPKSRPAVGLINELKPTSNGNVIVTIATVIGAGLGIVLGFAMRKVSVGVIVGAGLGMAIGIAISQLRRRK